MGCTLHRPIQVAEELSERASRYETESYFPLEYALAVAVQYRWLEKHVAEEPATRIQDAECRGCFVRFIIFQNEQ